MPPEAELMVVATVVLGDDSLTVADVARQARRPGGVEVRINCSATKHSEPANLPTVAQQPHGNTRIAHQLDIAEPPFTSG